MTDDDVPAEPEVVPESRPATVRIPGAVRPPIDLSTLKVDPTVIASLSAAVSRLSSAYTAAMPKIDVASLLPIAKQVQVHSASMQEVAERLSANLAPIMRRLAYFIAETGRSWWPANLRRIDLDADVVEALADEGLTVWSVPREAVTRRLLQAPDRAARRAILGRSADVILTDCSAVAARAGSGAHRQQAQFLEQAIRAIQDGHIAAGQALATNTLESVLHLALTSERRVSMISHGEKKQIDHFRVLGLAEAMVFRPIWHAYRPQYTPEHLAVATSFARHGAAHRLTPRQVSKRNAVQAVMLTAALLDWVTFWDKR